MQKINSSYFKRFLFCFLFVAFAFLFCFSVTLIPKNTAPVLADGGEGPALFGAEGDAAHPTFDVEAFDVFLSSNSTFADRLHLGYGKTLLADGLTMPNRLYITTDTGTLANGVVTHMQLRFYPNSGGSMQWADFSVTNNQTIFVDLANSAANPNLIANPFFNNGGRWEIGERNAANSLNIFNYELNGEAMQSHRFNDIGTYLFDVYPRTAISLANAGTPTGSDVNNPMYTHHIGSSNIAGKVVLPTLEYDSKFFVPDFKVGNLAGAKEDYLVSGTTRRAVLTDANRYIITLDTKKHVTFPQLQSGYTMALDFSTTVDIFGAKILHHSVRKDEFIAFDASKNLLTPEIVTPASITGAGTNNLLINGTDFFNTFDDTYSTNRVSVSWSLNPQPITLVSGTPNAERIERYTVPTATRFFAAYEGGVWSQHTFNPRSTIGQTGYHVVQITTIRHEREINQQGTTVNDTSWEGGTPISVHTQTFAFFVRNINPRVRLETFRQDFAPDSAAIADALPLVPMTIGGGGITNQPVTVMIDENDTSIFDDVPSFSLQQLVGGTQTHLNQIRVNGTIRNVSFGTQTTVESGDIIGLISTAGARQEFLITTQFGVANHNDERSTIYTDFVIDNRPIQLIPFRNNVLSELVESENQLPPLFSTLDITTNHIGLMADEQGNVVESFGILANLQETMSSSIKNMLDTARSNQTGVVAQTDLTQIERAEYRVTHLRSAQNFVDDTDAILDTDANYISALFGANNRSGWTTFLGNIDNERFTHSEAGLYEFRFMDKASNIAYFFVYIDLLAPNAIYTADNTVVGSLTPWEDEFITHNVYFGEYKAVKLSTTVSPAPADDTALVPMPGNTFVGDNLTLRHNGRGKAGFEEMPVLKSEIGSSGEYDYYLLTSIAKENLNEVPPASDNYVYYEPGNSLSPEFLTIEELPSSGGTGSYQTIDFYKAPFNGKEPGTNNTVDLIINRPTLASYYNAIRNAIVEYSRGITNTHFFVSENLRENEGRYRIYVRDQFGNSGYNEFRIDFDPTKIAFLAKTSPSDSSSNYFGNEFADIRNGTGDDATGTNFGTIDVRSLATHNIDSVVDFNLTEITFEHTAPNYSQLNNIYGAAGTPGTLFHRTNNIGLDMINAYGVFYKPELNTYSGTSTTQHGKYQITRKIELLGGSVIPKTMDGKEFFKLSETYTLYVDRTGVITSIDLGGGNEQQIGRYNQVDVYTTAGGTKNSYDYGNTWQFGERRQINLDNLGDRIQRDDNGEIETVLGLEPVFSNLTNAALSIQRQKYDTTSLNGLPTIFELKHETIALGDSGFERSYQTNYTDTNRFSIIISDGLNSTITLSDKSKTLYGNASAFAFELNRTSPKGEAKEAVTNDAIDQFVLKEVAGIRWENIQNAQWKEPEYDNLKNTYFVQPDSNNFLFEISNDLAPEGISAIVDFNAITITRYPHNGKTIDFSSPTSIARPAGTGLNGFEKQTLSLERTNGVVYVIYLKFFDRYNLLTSHIDSTFYVFVDKTAPAHNLERVKAADYFRQQLARPEVSGQIDFGNDYIYMLPTTFKFQRQGAETERTTHLDSSTLYFRPKGGVSQNWLALDYNKEFGLEGLYEIKELDAAGNESTYFVQFGNPDVQNRILAADYNYFPQVKVNNAQTVSANPAEWVASGDKDSMVFNAVPRLDLTTPPLASGIDATLSRRLGMEMNWIDSDDSYFLVEVVRTLTPMESPAPPVGSNRVVFPVYATRDKAQIITNSIAERILASPMSPLYNIHFRYNEELGSQYTIRILDRMTTANHATSLENIKYFNIVLNLSPQKRARPTEPINGALPMSDYIGLNRVLPNPDGQLAVYWSHDISSMPHYGIDNIKVERQVITTENGNQITTWLNENINGFSADKNSPRKFNIGIYRITYTNSFGYEFMHYLSDPVTSAYFKSLQGDGVEVLETVQNINNPSESETVAVPYFGDNLFDDSDANRPIGNFSFTFNHQAFIFEQLVVNIGNTTQYLNARDLGSFVKNGTATHPISPFFERIGNNDIIKFKPAVNANIRYTVILRYREGIGEADGSRLLAVHAGYYTVLPRIQMRDQFDMFRQLVTENPFIATSAKIETISTQYMGEDVLFFDYVNPTIRMSAIGYNLDGTPTEIKFGDQTSTTVPSNYIFSASGSGYSRIEFTLTIVNDVGTFANYQVIIDSSSRPPYIVMQGNTQLKASSERWHTHSSSIPVNFLATPTVSALTQKEFDNGFYTEMYYTTGTVSADMIIPDLDRGLNRVERVDNGGLCVNGNTIQLFKVFSDSPHITSVYFVRISHITTVTASQDLNGLALRHSTAQSITRGQHRLYKLTGQNSIHILFSRNHTNWRPIEEAGGTGATTNINAPYYGMQFYAEVEIENSKAIDLMGSIHLTASGVYKIKYFDLANNVQRFTYSNITYDYQEAILMNHILVNVTAANTMGTMELQNDMVLESLPGGQNVSLSVIRPDLYNGTIHISNLTRNGMRYGEQELPIENLRLDMPGVYTLTLQGTLNTIGITTTYRIFVINPREQRLGLDLVFANTFGARQTVETITQSFLGQFPIEINRSDLISAPFTKVVLSPFDSGSGRYRVRVAVNSGSEYKQTEYYWFEVLVGGPTPFVTTSSKPGSSTTSKAYITFNPGYIYENFGAARILINGEVVHTINHASSYDDVKITLSMGQNIVEIQTESGALNFVRFTINRTRPLGALTIIIIVICSILFVVAVVVFFRLRTRMKVK